MKKVTELKNGIERGFKLTSHAAYLDFNCCELDEVVNSLVLRDIDDIHAFLPEIMLEMVDRVEAGEEIFSIEHLFYIMNGYSTDDDLKVMAKLIKNSMSKVERSCIASWFNYLHKNNVGRIAHGDLVSCIDYWEK